MSDSAGTDVGLGTPDRGDGPGRRGSDQVKVGGEKRPGRVRRSLTFYRQVVAELRKVIWPTRRELLTYTSVVLVFVLFMVAVVSLYDFVFSQGVLRVFG
jgi:preprotein translocase subunit SecE